MFLEDYQKNILKTAKLSSELLARQLAEKYRVPAGAESVRVFERLFLKKAQEIIDGELLEDKIEELASVLRNKK